MTKEYNIAEKSILDLEQDLIKQTYVVYDKGAEWAKAQAEFEQLEDLKHTVLAQSMNGEGSIASQETEARASKLFMDHLKGLSEARHKALVAKVAYVSSQNKYDALRTILSNKRETVKRGIE